MEVLPVILDFRSAGNAASRTVIIHNKQDVHVEFVLPSVSGPYSIRCHDAACQAAHGTTDHEHVVATRRLRLHIPPKRFAAMLVVLRSTDPDADDASSYDRECYCAAGLFPIIPLKWPSNTQCVVAIGPKAWPGAPKLSVDKHNMNFLQSYEVPKDTVTRMLERTTAQLCELETGTLTCADADKVEFEELEGSRDQGFTEAITACPESLATYQLKPQSAVNTDADRHSLATAFQAVKLEVNGRHASVVKVIPVPYRMPSKKDAEIVSRSEIAQDAKPGPDATFQVCGKWYDARGKEVAQDACVRDMAGSPVHGMGREEVSVVSHMKQVTVESLRDAALAAAQAELGLFYIPESVHPKGLCGVHKPLLPMLKEAKDGHAGASHAGHVGQNCGARSKRLETGNHCASSTKKLNGHKMP